MTSLERSAIATGSESGQVCLWCVEPAAGVCSGSSVRLSPRVVLLGHTSEIAWLACCAFERSEALVSVCRSGFVNVWDPMDGRCLSSSSSPMLSGATVGAAAMLPRLGLGQGWLALTRALALALAPTPSRWARRQCYRSWVTPSSEARRCSSAC